MCVVHRASKGELHTDSSELVACVLCIVLNNSSRSLWGQLTIHRVHIIQVHILYRHMYILYGHMYYTDTHTV